MGRILLIKSEILEELIPALQQEQRFFCITALDVLEKQLWQI